MPIAPAGGHAVTHRPAPEPAEAEARPQSRAEADGPGHEPGGGRPSDFGPGGNADYNHDGRISDNEASVFKTRSYEREEKYEARLERSNEHEEHVEDLQEARIDAETDREKARYDAYGDQVKAQADMYSSSNNNKMHQIFGKTQPAPNLPPPPSQGA